MKEDFKEWFDRLQKKTNEIEILNLRAEIDGLKKVLDAIEYIAEEAPRHKSKWMNSMELIRKFANSALRDNSEESLLSRIDELELADELSNHIYENNVKEIGSLSSRLKVFETALKNIRDIPNNTEGGDWDEIEEARNIAIDALDDKKSGSIDVKNPNKNEINTKMLLSIAKNAWVSGYEQGHHDTVETGYYDPASQWDDDEQIQIDILDSVLDGEPAMSGDELMTRITVGRPSSASRRPAMSDKIWKEEAENLYSLLLENSDMNSPRSCQVEVIREALLEAAARAPRWVAVEDLDLETMLKVGAAPRLDGYCLVIPFPLPPLPEEDA